MFFLISFKMHNTVEHCFIMHIFVEHCFKMHILCRNVFSLEWKFTVTFIYEFWEFLSETWEANNVFKISFSSLSPPPIVFRFLFLRWQVKSHYLRDIAFIWKPLFLDNSKVVLVCNNGKSAMVHSSVFLLTLTVSCIEITNPYYYHLNIDRKWLRL